ncbi:hypothetical protein AOQ84DRAFT_70203 [Glonium stellatum]|uniref:Uncharacterized protein n=1 Tax=Glonium stellatum TaxID=574774 RepID=A0A8E2EXY4_9PEZI|nr:hypothetical protein AOQ84DRAFT_70203 [Glonium stellatum]
MVAIYKALSTLVCSALMACIFSHTQNHSGCGVIFLFTFCQLSSLGVTYLGNGGTGSAPSPNPYQDKPILCGAHNCLELQPLAPSWCRNKQGSSVYGVLALWSSRLNLYTRRR